MAEASEVRTPEIPRTAAAFLRGANHRVTPQGAKPLAHQERAVQQPHLFGLGVQNVPAHRPNGKGHRQTGLAVPPFPQVDVRHLAAVPPARQDGVVADEERRVGPFQHVLQRGGHREVRRRSPAVALEQDLEERHRCG